MSTIAARLGIVPPRTEFEVGDWVTVKDQDRDSITEDLIGRGFRVVEIEIIQCTCESDVATRVLNGPHEPCCLLQMGSDQLVSIDFEGETMAFNGSFLTLTTAPIEEE